LVEERCASILSFWKDAPINWEETLYNFGRLDAVLERELLQTCHLKNWLVLPAEIIEIYV